MPAAGLALTPTLRAPGRPGRGKSRNRHCVCFAWRVGNYAHGLEPWMMPGHYAAVFVNFALKSWAWGQSLRQWNQIPQRFRTGTRKTGRLPPARHKARPCPAPTAKKRKQPPVANLCVPQARR